MLVFDPKNPFPLVRKGEVSLAEAQAHAALVDNWLGLQAGTVEINVKEEIYSQPDDGQEPWAGLPVKTLLTPYTDFRLILEQLAPRRGQTIVDLGAAYGRLGFVISQHWLGVGFVGYELIEERVREGRRCLERFEVMPEIQLLQADLLAPEFMPQAADFYFMYDFGSRQAIDKTIYDLFIIAQKRSITVVGRGGRTRDAIERRNPWLSQVIEPEHFPHYSIYRSSVRSSP